MKNTPENRDKILQTLRAGNAYSQAASSAGISRVTLAAWRKADPDFDEQCHVAESDGIKVIEDVILKTATGAEDKTLAYQAAKFIVERRKPTRDDYAPQNPNVPFGQLQLNVLAQIAPPLMQLGGQPSNTALIEGEIDRT